MPLSAPHTPSEPLRISIELHQRVRQNSIIGTPGGRVELVPDEVLAILPEYRSGRYARHCLGRVYTAIARVPIAQLCCRVRDEVFKVRNLDSICGESIEDIRIFHDVRLPCPTSSAPSPRVERRLTRTGLSNLHIPPTPLLHFGESIFRSPFQAPH